MSRVIFQAEQSDPNIPKILFITIDYLRPFPVNGVIMASHNLYSKYFALRHFLR